MSLIRDAIISKLTDVAVDVSFIGASILLLYLIVRKLSWFKKSVGFISDIRDRANFNRDYQKQQLRKKQYEKRAAYNSRRSAYYKKRGW